MLTVAALMVERGLRATKLQVSNPRTRGLQTMGCPRRPACHCAGRPPQEGPGHLDQLWRAHCRQGGPPPPRGSHQGVLIWFLGTPPSGCAVAPTAEAPSGRSLSPCQVGQRELRPRVSLPLGLAVIPARPLVGSGSRLRRRLAPCVTRRRVKTIQVPMPKGRGTAWRSRRQLLGLPLGLTPHHSKAARELVL